MANHFNLVLDTTGPSNPTILLDGGATYCSLISRLVMATIGCGDSDTTGYQMKIWGDVDVDNDADIKAIEDDSKWITFQTNKQIKLSAGDGPKIIYLKIRDDVYNPSFEVNDSITLDTTLPVVTITGPDVSKISKQDTKNEAAFSFSSNSVFDEYKVKVVANSGAAHDTGTQIPTTNGSTFMSGSAGNYPAGTPINCKIRGADLETASSGDGDKCIKVFVKDQAGNWSAA